MFAEVYSWKDGRYLVLGLFLLFSFVYDILKYLKTSWEALIFEEYNSLLIDGLWIVDNDTEAEWLEYEDGAYGNCEEWYFPFVLIVGAEFSWLSSAYMID